MLNVAPSSPGATAGFARGDQVIELDGKPSKEFTLDEMRKAIRLDGKRQVTVVRDGKRVKLMMELRRAREPDGPGGGSRAPRPRRRGAPPSAALSGRGPRRLEDAGRDLAAHSLAQGAAGDDARGAVLEVQHHVPRLAALEVLGGRRLGERDAGPRPRGEDPAVQPQAPARRPVVCGPRSAPQ